ncbi:MAG: biotin/lipoyl-binding protein, partial [Treponema sp.]|nr:biotin/lipoyl-binding protein [Treponema sp.]
AAVQGQIHDYISLSGDILAGSTIDVYPEVPQTGGRITQLYVSVGSRVNRGSSIASIDPSRPGMTFRQSVATYRRIPGSASNRRKDNAALCFRRQQGEQGLFNSVNRSVPSRDDFQAERRDISDQRNCCHADGAGRHDGHIGSADCADRRQRA